MSTRLSTQRSFLPRVTGRIPFSVNITGTRRRVLLATFDALFREREGLAVVEAEGRRIVIDRAQPNERLLSYFFGNVLRQYRRSPLGRHLAGMNGRAGGIFVDIGANLGIYSLIANELGFEAWLFEPEPAHAAFLERNADAFGQVSCLALSDRAETKELLIAGGRSLGASSLVPSDRGWEASDYVGRTMVQLERFDGLALVRETDLSRLRLIKIDVEGNEASTVRGIETILTNGCRPDIWCEVRGPGSDRNPDSYLKVVEILSGRGYQPLRFDGKRRGRFDPTTTPVPRIFDLLFTRDGNVAPV